MSIRTSWKVDARSDIYSLGVILYELLTAELPFRGQTRMLLLQVIQDEPRPPRRLNDKIPRDLETICLKSMAKEPGRRYASARELADDLRRYLKGEPIHARPVSAWERGWNWAKRRPAVAALTISVAGLLVILAMGSFIAAVYLRAALTASDANRERAETAERDKTERLWEAYLAQARAGRWSGRPGRRLDGLNPLTKAAAIRPALELRNEAIACLALTDLRVGKLWEGPPRWRKKGTGTFTIDFSPLSRSSCATISQ